MQVLKTGTGVNPKRISLRRIAIARFAVPLDIDELSGREKLFRRDTDGINAHAIADILAIQLIVRLLPIQITRQTKDGTRLRLPTDRIV